MPKKLSDKDRILSFAFRASTEELVDAISVLKAAHAAKASGASAPRSVRSAPVRKPAPKVQPSDGQTEG